MVNYKKPLPLPDADSAPYWEACRRHELLLQRCLGCKSFRFPPAMICPGCGAAGCEWVRSAGKGKVYSWIVVERPIPADMFAGDVPYVVALIDLDEGVRLASNVVACDPRRIVLNMPVEVTFDDVTGQITLPKFRPRRGEGE